MPLLEPVQPLLSIRVCPGRALEKLEFVYLHPKNFRIYLLYINQPYLLLPNFLNTFCITTFKIHTWLLRGAWYCCNNKIWLFKKSTIDAGVKFARLL